MKKLLGPKIDMRQKMVHFETFIRFSNLILMLNLRLKEIFFAAKFLLTRESGVYKIYQFSQGSTGLFKPYRLLDLRFLEYLRAFFNYNLSILDS